VSKRKSEKPSPVNENSEITFVSNFYQKEKKKKKKTNK